MNVDLDERGKVGEERVWKNLLLFMETQHDLLRGRHGEEKFNNHMLPDTGVIIVDRLRSYLGLCEVLLAVWLVVLLLHERNPAQLAFLEEWLDVHGTKSITTDAFIVL